MPAWYNVAMVVRPSLSVMTRMAFAQSKAVLASKPRVELSQQKMLPRVARHSRIDTRLRSPPETPRMYASPTLLSCVCSIAKALSRNSLYSREYCSVESILGGRSAGTFNRVAKSSVRPTDKVGKKTSSSAFYSPGQRKLHINGKYPYLNNLAAVVPCFIT